MASKVDKLPLETELVARENNTILTLKTVDQTWSRLTKLIIVVYYSTVDRYTTDSRPIFHRQSMVNISAECRALFRPRYRSIYRLTLGRYLDRHIGYADRHISVDISAECWPIYRPTHRSRGVQNTRSHLLINFFL